ncbi:unnamed protein product [Arabidopsis lyrata]|uniref:Transmembrane protein n=2 Tax=Arabidopsis lyrata subsp. lyrata TaxID=81972 RepID=D7L1E4_ARALL|nr:hypothetical protein ARALYDRAFT_318121 [Arabidopsis lyrata subsp. lyrata]CAH8260331.1 unnamed protein product [Arabidopsis lyrata]
MNWKLVLLFGWILLSSIASNPTLAKVTYPPRTTRKGLGNIHINKGMKIGFTGSFSRPAPHGGGPPKIISKL